MDKLVEYTKTQFESRFTKTSECVKHIDELKKLNLFEITDKELKTKINNCFNIIPFTSALIPAGSELFRARLNINDNPFTSVEDIYAPPADKIKKNGRANKAGERIFYCASNFKLAAFEVLKDLKHSFNPKSKVASLTIGIWKIKVDLHVSNITYSEKLHSLREDILLAFNETQKTLHDNGNLSDDILTSNKMILEYFAEEFIKDNIKDESDYKVCNYYVSALKTSSKLIAPQYSSDKFDGINYPSVAMKYKGDNQALFIESADLKLEIVNAIQVLCGNLDFEKGDYTAGILHEADSIINGEITWKNEIYKP